MFRFAASAVWISFCALALCAPASAHEPMPRLAAALSAQIVGMPVGRESAPTLANVHRASLPPDIPGVTYPRKAPPDLVSGEPPASEIDIPDATAAGANAAVPAAPAITLELGVDLTQQRLTVTENGAVKYVWPISSGRAGYPTRVGTFQPQWASRMWYSRQYEMAPMPYAVFFNGGIAFHGTSATHLLGRPASHGCVRLATPNAKLLYGLIHRHGFKATEIKVYGNSSVVSGVSNRATGERRKSKRAVSSREPQGLLWGLF